jgi:hypothetical protein
VIQVSLPQILTICAGNTIAQDGVNAMWVGLEYCLETHVKKYT